MRKVLELPAFRRLLAVTIVSEIAVSVGAVALALFVYRRTGSAIGAMAFFLCAQFGPAFFSPLFVSRLDQRAVRTGLSLLYAAEGLIFLLLAVLLGRLSVAPILVLVLIDGSFAVAARVLARSAWTSVTSPARLLREANALANSSLSICYMLGPALGGAVVAAGGTRTSLFVDTGLFVLMAVIVVTGRALPTAKSHPAPNAGRLRAAFRRARAEPLLRRLLGVQAIGMIVFTLTIPVDVVFAQHTLRAGPGGYGALLSAWGAGTIIGSAAYARWRARPSRELITVGTSVVGIAFLVMAIAPGLAVALAGAALGGVGNGIQVVAMRTALQEAIPADSMALMLSLSESIFQAAPGAGILLGGVITALTGARAALAIAAVGSLLVALLFWVRLTGRGQPISGNAYAVEPTHPDVGLTTAPRRP